jgi:hypothetical protein
VSGEVKHRRAEAKASLKQGDIQSDAADPKPGELSMARLKRG